MGGDDEQTTETTNSPWGPYAENLENVFGRANTLSQTPGSFFGGQTYAGFDPLQAQGMQGQLDYAGGGLQDQVAGFQDASQFALNAPDVANNPYIGGMADVIGNRLQSNLDTSMGNIRDRMIDSGQTGGSRHGVAQGIAIEGNQQALGDALAGLYGGAYGQGLSAQGSALGMAPQTAQLGMLPGQVQSSIGGQMQGMEQRGIDEAMQRHSFSQNEPWDRLSKYNSMLSGGQGYGSTSSTTTQANDPFGQLLGVGMMGAGAMTGNPSMMMGGFGGAMGAGANPMDAYRSTQVNPYTQTMNMW
jgi:hypothetical protein